MSTLEKLEGEAKRFLKENRKTVKMRKIPCRKCGEIVQGKYINKKAICEPCRKLKVALNPHLSNSTQWYLDRGLILVWLHGMWILQPKELALANKKKGARTFPEEW